MATETSELNDSDYKILLFLVRNRLKYEARRPSRPKEGRGDIQSLKVWELSELQDKLEKLRLAS